MLVLTRKKEQSIIIGGDIEIMVLGVSGDKVRLGIDAPREVEVFRKEVIDDRAAATAAGEPDQDSQSDPDLG
jgi:carbon storage regulator